MVLRARRIKWISCFQTHLSSRRPRARRKTISWFQNSLFSSWRVRVFLFFFFLGGGWWVSGYGGRGGDLGAGYWKILKSNPGLKSNSLPIKLLKLVSYVKAEAYASLRTPCQGSHKNKKKIGFKTIFFPSLRVRAPEKIWFIYFFAPPNNNFYTSRFRASVHNIPNIWNTNVIRLVWQFLAVGLLRVSFFFCLLYCWQLKTPNTRRVIFSGSIVQLMALSNMFCSVRPRCQLRRG